MSSVTYGLEGQPRPTRLALVDMPETASVTLRLRRAGYSEWETVPNRRVGRDFVAEVPPLPVGDHAVVWTIAWDGKTMQWPTDDDTVRELPALEDDEPVARRRWWQRWSR